MSRYVTVSTDVDIYLDEIDTDDLVQELNSRGASFGASDGDEFGMRTLLGEIFELKRNGRDFSQQLDALIYKSLGRIV